MLVATTWKCRHLLCAAGLCWAILDCVPSPLLARIASSLVLASSLAGCSGSQASTAADYARAACEEWQNYSASLRDGPVDTSLLPLAEDDAALAAERDSRYRTLHERIAEAASKVEAGTTRLPVRETARVDGLCTATGRDPQ